MDFMDLDIIYTHNAYIYNIIYIIYNIYIYNIYLFVYLFMYLYIYVYTFYMYIKLIEFFLWFDEVFHGPTERGCV